MFRVELFRPDSMVNIQSKASEKASEKTLEKHWRNEINDTQVRIIEILSVNNQLSAAQMAEEIGISRRNIEMSIKKLKQYGMLVRHGSPKKGYWEIIKK